MEKKLFGAMLIIVIGLALLPIVNDSVVNLDTTNMSTAVVTLIDFLPLVYVLILVVGAVSYIKFS